MAGKHLNVPLNALRAFSVAARHRNFTAAAQELGVTQVAVSRQIATLESYLDVSLFKRGPRSVRLTDAGRAFALEISGPFEDIDRATQRLLDRETENTVNLRIHPTFAQLWLLPRLGRFRAEWPEIRIRFDTRVEPLDFGGTHLDLAVQLGRGDWRDTRRRKLFDEEVDVVCSPGYAATLPRLDRPEDVAAAELLHARYRRRAWEFWASAVGIELDCNRGTEFDSSLLALAAAQHGFGLAVGQLGLVDGMVGSGQLVRPLDMRVPTGAAFWVVWPTASSVGVKSRRFVDWLLSEVGEAPEFYPGREPGKAAAARR